MDAIVPAAGRGTRLRPVTDEKPKGLVEVDGTPILTRAFEQLTAAGVDKLVVVVGYLGDQIVDRYGDSFRGTPVEYVTQDEQLGIGHALDLAADAVGEEFVMMLGDNVFERPQADVVAEFRDSGADLVFAVEQVPWEQAGRHAVCEMTEDGEVRDVVEKPDDPVSNHVMTGFLVASRSMLDVCADLEPSDRGEYELGDALRTMIDRGMTVTAAPLAGERVNINTREDVERAEAMLADST